MADDRPPDAGAPPGFGPLLQVGPCWTARCTGPAKILLRGHAGDERFAGAFQHLLQVAPPRPGRAVVAESGEVLWLGPTTWLLVAAGASPESLFEHLERGFADCRAAVVDQSSARQRVRIGGQGAEDLLARGCDLVLDPATFGPGHCASTLLGPFSVTLHRRAQDGAFDVLVWRSYAQSLWRWIAGALGATDQAGAVSATGGEGSPNG